MISTILVFIMKISFLKRWFFFVPASSHFFLVLILTIYTSYVLPPTVLPTYLIFSGVFLISTLFSLNSILRFRTSVFYYLLNLMFLLGFWFKYSLQKITSLNYREPIGLFIESPEAETRVLWVVIWGMLGFILSQASSYFLFNKAKISESLDRKNRLSKKGLVLLIASAIVLSLLNLKFNILLFALRPSVILPLKGNAIYFLALTRGILFLFFFYFFRTFSIKMVFWGALIASICSIGVLSRMVVLIYFSVPMILILQNLAIWRFKKTLFNILITLLIFALFSFSTVLISTGLRNIYIKQPSPSQSKVVKDQETTIQKLDSQQSLPPENKIIESQKITLHEFDLKQEAKTYKSLALGRWIGIEGVMAVDSYPQKSFAFLWDALKEEGYRGRSFYTKISNPAISPTAPIGEIISTSVPGPIAFFYYSGNTLFVFFAIFASTFLLSSLEQLALKFSKNNAVGVFISTFIVFDFFQFGISPLAFVRYLSFSLVSIAIFYYFIGYRHQKGIYENN